MAAKLASVSSVRGVVSCTGGARNRGLFDIETGAEGQDDVDTVGSKILEYTVLTCFFSDSYFSVVVTGLFLKPVMSTLKDGRGIASVQKSVGYKKMRQTVYMMLFGSSLAVPSPSP